MTGQELELPRYETPVKGFDRALLIQSSSNGLLGEMTAERSYSGFSQIGGLRDVANIT